MRYVCLNPRVLDTAQKMHEYLRDALGFPAYYGMNLDALNDVMTEPRGPISILCLRYVRAGESVCPFADRFYRVLSDCAKENADLRVDVIEIPATINENFDRPD